MDTIIHPRELVCTTDESGSEAASVTTQPEEKQSTQSMANQLRLDAKSQRDSGDGIKDHVVLSKEEASIPAQEKVSGYPNGTDKGEIVCPTARYLSINTKEMSSYDLLVFPAKRPRIATPSPEESIHEEASQSDLPNSPTPAAQPILECIYFENEKLNTKVSSIFGSYVGKPIFKKPSSAKNILSRLIRVPKVSFREKKGWRVTFNKFVTRFTSAGALSEVALCEGHRIASDSESGDNINKTTAKKLPSVPGSLAEKIAMKRLVLHTDSKELIRDKQDIGWKLQPELQKFRRESIRTYAEIDLKSVESMESGVDIIDMFPNKLSLASFVKKRNINDDLTNNNVINSVMNKLPEEVPIVARLAQSDTALASPYKLRKGKSSLVLQFPSFVVLLMTAILQHRKNSLADSASQAKFHCPSTSSVISQRNAKTDNDSIEDISTITDTIKMAGDNENADESFNTQPIHTAVSEPAPTRIRAIKNTNSIHSAPIDKKKNIRRKVQKQSAMKEKHNWSIFFKQVVSRMFKRKSDMKSSK